MRPSSLRSHWTWMPRPAGTPRAITSTTPPTRVAGPLRAVDRGHHRVRGGDVHAPDRALLDGVEGFPGRRRRRGRATVPMRTTWLRTSIPDSRSRARARRRRRPATAVSRALARSSTSRRSSVVLEAAREVGVARARDRRRRARRAASGCGSGASRPASSRGRGSRSGWRRGCRASVRGGRRRRSPPCRSRSSCARRGRSRAAGGARSASIVSRAEGQAGRQALDDRDERRAVRFAGGEKAQHGPNRGARIPDCQGTRACDACGSVTSRASSRRRCP